MEKIDPQIQSYFDDARENVANFLIREAGDDKVQEIIRRYTAAIEGNFVSWMGAAAISARSPQGRYAASENLWVEMKDDHAGMLRSFAKDANATPNAVDYDAVASDVEQLRTLVAEMSGLKNLILMATLENTSAAFIPLLEGYATQLGSSNLTYSKIHGEADIEHAEQFAWAVDHERHHYQDADKVISETIATTINFLKSIFT